MKTQIITITLLLLAGCSNQNGLGYQGTGGQSAYGQNTYGTNANTGAATGTNAGAGNVNYIEQSIGDTVLFPVDQYFLTPQAKQILDSQAQWIINSPNQILIEGHADEQGTREYNLALGARRASAVREYFIGKGIPASRIDVVSYGKERPLAICSDETCWSKNRRAVTVVK